MDVPIIKYTPFLRGVLEGNRAAELEEYLINENVPVDALVYHGNTLLHVAASNGACETVKMLLRRGYSEVRNQWGQTPLLAYFKNYNRHFEEIVGAFADAGHDINAIDREDFSPLARTCEFRSLDDAKFIIERGAQVNPSLALHVAVFRDRKELVDYLLSIGADVNAQDRLGRTPLIVVYTRRVPNNLIARKLLEAGADPNISDKDGRTPLHKAINMKCVIGVRDLLKHGADTSAKCKYEMWKDPVTPRDLALRQGLMYFVKMIDDHNAPDVKHPAED